MRSLQMCPINDTFVSAGEDGTVRLWDLRSSHTVVCCSFAGYIGTCADVRQGLLHSGGGTTLAAIDATGEVMAVVCSATKVIALYGVKELDRVCLSRSPSPGGMKM